jgi:mRNA degradation ribonuclease J1/J2
MHFKSPLQELVAPERIRDMNPNELLIVTTGSQAEPRAQLSLAAKEASHMLKIMPNDLLLYRWKCMTCCMTSVLKLYI